jgi:hypothetical protein
MKKNKGAVLRLKRMPTGCWECPCGSEWQVCMACEPARDFEDDDGRPGWCPLEVEA